MMNDMPICKMCMTDTLRDMDVVNVRKIFRDLMECVILSDAGSGIVKEFSG